MAHKWCYKYNQEVRLRPEGVNLRLSHTLPQPSEDGSLGALEVRRKEEIRSSLRGSNQLCLEGAKVNFMCQLNWAMVPG